MKAAAKSAAPVKNAKAAALVKNSINWVTKLLSELPTSNSKRLELEAALEKVAQERDAALEQSDQAFKALKEIRGGQQAKRRRDKGPGHAGWIVWAICHLNAFFMQPLL